MGVLLVVTLFCWALLVTRGRSEARGGKAYIEVSLYDKDANGDYVEKNKSKLEGNFTPAGVMERAQGSLKQVGRLASMLLTTVKLAGYCTGLLAQYTTTMSVLYPSLRYLSLPPLLFLLFSYSLPQNLSFPVA